LTRRLPAETFDAIVKAYRDDKMSLMEVAQQFQISHFSVRKILEQHGVARRPVGRHYNH